jgi:hypothetical protein
MESFLTLVIAVGGIATGIGAIWTAMLARRQLNEQRHFLEEQNEIARSQARLTEQSLAQTERNLTEQNKRAREENERARRSYEVDMMLELDDRWESPAFLDIKRKAANHVKAHFFADDNGGLLEVQHMDVNAERLLGIFELLGTWLSRERCGPRRCGTGSDGALDNTGPCTGRLSKRCAQSPKTRRSSTISSDSRL